MRPELESRLERAFAELPGAAPDVEVRARRAAVAAVPRHTRRAGPVGIAVVAAAGAGIAALSLLGLRATGTIHLQIGSRARAEQRAIPAQRLVVPTGADGIAAVVDGRLWLSTRRGMHIEGLPVSAAGLSPHALYVGVGLGRSLVAMAPDRRLAWTHATRGTVTAVAWAPDGLRVAYIVRIGGHYALRMIEGDGDHDALLDASVRPVRPAWRPDSLALAYVGAGGHAVVLDLGRRSRRLLAATACGPVRALAFADAGAHLAAVGARGVVVDGRCLGTGEDSSTGAVAWTGPRGVVTDTGSTLQYVDVIGGRADRASAACPRVSADALASWPSGLAAAARAGAGIEVRVLTGGARSNGCLRNRGTPLLALATARWVTSLDVR
jgi:hypothetical protein